MTDRRRIKVLLVGKIAETSLAERRAKAPPAGKKAEALPTGGRTKILLVGGKKILAGKTLLVKRIGA